MNKDAVAAHYDALDICIAAMVDSFPKEGWPELYSCAFWTDPRTMKRRTDLMSMYPGITADIRTDVEVPVLAKNLTEANEWKLAATADRLHLERGMRVLEIGCGDGALAYYLAKAHGVTVDGITLSERQLERAQMRARTTPGLAFHLMDYNDAARLGNYDRVVSVGMMEHVGRENLARYARVIRQALKPAGRALIHTIFRSQNQGVGSNPWIAAYIFPGGYIPSRNDLRETFASNVLRTEWFHFHAGVNYALTLEAWHKRLHNKWDSIAHQLSDPDAQKRTMDFYLQSCATWFRESDGAVVQLELVPA